jgi:hypothetical protein
MKASINSTHANAFARITKFHNAKTHEAKRNDQSAYDSVCGLMQVDSCLFAAPQGFATWTIEAQMRKVASDFGLVIELPVSISMEVNS